MQSIKFTEPDGTIKTVRMDGFMRDALDLCVKRMKAGFQVIIPVCGYGGTGKSELTKVNGYYIAKQVGTPYSEKNFHFEAEELTSAINSGPDMSVQILDESTKDFSTSASRTQNFAHLINNLNLSRVKRCCIFLLLPDFFSLSKTYNGPILMILIPQHC